MDFELLANLVDGALQIPHKKRASVQALVRTEVGRTLDDPEYQMAMELAFVLGLERKDVKIDNLDSYKIDKDEYFHNETWHIRFRPADIPYLLAYGSEWEEAFLFAEAIGTKEKIDDMWPTNHGGAGSETRYSHEGPLFCPLEDERLHAFQFRRNFCYFKSFPPEVSKNTISATLAAVTSTQRKSKYYITRAAKGAITLQLMASLSPDSNKAIIKAVREALKRELGRKQYSTLESIAAHAAWLELQGENHVKWLAERLREQVGAQRWMLLLLKKPTEDELVEGYKTLLTFSKVKIAERTKYVRHLSVDPLISVLKKSSAAKLNLVDFLINLPAEAFDTLTEEGQTRLRPYLAHAVRDSRLTSVFDAADREASPWLLNFGDLEGAEGNWVRWADRILAIRRSWQAAHTCLKEVCSPYEKRAPLLMLAIAVMAAPAIGVTQWDSEDNLQPPRVLDLWFQRNPPTREIEHVMGQLSSLWVPPRAA